MNPGKVHPKDLYVDQLETVNATPDLDAKLNPKDLASKTVNTKLIGMPVSGKPWKKINKT